jgi:hypothetical protein
MNNNETAGEEEGQQQQQQQALVCSQFEILNLNEAIEIVDEIRGQEREQIDSKTSKSNQILA